MADPALGHPASVARLSLSRPSAPVALPLIIGADVVLIALAALMVLTDAPWWSFLLPLALVATLFTIYGRRSAKALGIRSRDETPRRWLAAMALPSGVVGILAASSGRYAGAVITAYIVLVQVGERLAWRQFRASGRATAQI